MNELIGKEVGVWKVKTNLGMAILLTPNATDPNVQVNVQETAKNVQAERVDVHYSAMEERISRLEKAVEQLYDLLSKKSDCSIDYSKNEWARPDLNRGSPPRKGGVITARPRAQRFDLDYYISTWLEI